MIEFRCWLGNVASWKNVIHWQHLLEVQSQVQILQTSHHLLLFLKRNLAIEISETESVSTGWRALRKKKPYQKVPVWNVVVLLIGGETAQIWNQRVSALIRLDLLVPPILVRKRLTSTMGQQPRQTQDQHLVKQRNPLQMDPILRPQTLILIRRTGTNQIRKFGKYLWPWGNLGCIQR